MSYVVLARKYRPNNFDEVIGQETPISILESFIKNNSIPHALIFCIDTFYCNIDNWKIKKQKIIPFH